MPRARSLARLPWDRSAEGNLRRMRRDHPLGLHTSRTHRMHAYRRRELPPLLPKSLPHASALPPFLVAGLSLPCTLSCLEKMQSSNSQVTEWDFSGTRGLANGGCQSSLSDDRESDTMSLSRGSSISHDSGGSVWEREQTRHQQQVELIERMVITGTNCVY